MELDSLDDEFDRIRERHQGKSGLITYHRIHVKSEVLFDHPLAVRAMTELLTRLWFRDVVFRQYESCLQELQIVARPSREDTRYPYIYSVEGAVVKYSE